MMSENNIGGESAGGAMNQPEFTGSLSTVPLQQPLTLQQSLMLQHPLALHPQEATHAPATSNTSATANASATAFFQQQFPLQPFSPLGHMQPRPLFCPPLPFLTNTGRPADIMASDSDQDISFETHDIPTCFNDVPELFQCFDALLSKPIESWKDSVLPSSANPIKINAGPSRQRLLELHALEYYKNMSPLVIEEMRSVVCSAYENKNRLKATRRSELSKSRSRSQQISSLCLEGELSEAKDFGCVDIVALVQFPGCDAANPLSALLNKEYHKKSLQRWRMKLLGDIPDSLHDLIDTEYHVQVTPLCSVLPFRRQWEACKRFQDSMGRHSASTPPCRLPPNCILGSIISGECFHGCSQSSQARLVSSLGKLNASQQRAVLGILSSCSPGHPNGVQLLQGPPGTGKTTTIVHLLGALLRQERDNGFGGSQAADERLPIQYYLRT